MMASELYTVAVTATFTAEPLAEPLAYWMSELGINADIQFAPYGQVFQSLLDPASVLASNRHGINVILLKLDDWQAPDDGTRTDASGRAEVGRIVQEFTAVLTAAASKSAVPHLILFCPSSPAAAQGDVDRGRFPETERVMASSLANVPNVYLVTSSDLIATYPAPRYDDPLADGQAHIPYTREFFVGLATMVARRVFGLTRKSYKAIVLDCDGTLWGGACGEEGVEGIRIGPSYRALQSFMVAQHDAGMLLCICSKNDDRDVAHVFDRHEGMVLKRDHIVSWRVNWREKSENIRTLAEELKLGLDSFVFIDDSPVECAEVCVRCPDVLVLQLPDEPERIPVFLQHVWAFDHLRVTEEDRHRAECYRSDVHRERSRRPGMTLEEFLESLQLRVILSPLLPSQVSRVSQLTHRTNQFNCTTIRRSEADIRVILESTQWECLTVHVKDRFGDYGLVGLVIFTTTAETLEVETFLLSCRVLGRRVEHHVLSQLGRIAEERNLMYIDVLCRRTARNLPAFTFLDTVAERLPKSDDGDFIFRLGVEQARSLKDRSYPKMAATEGLPFQGATLTTRTAGIDQAMLLSRIASDLNEVNRILKDMLSRRGPRTLPQLPPSPVCPLTPIEDLLSALWRDALDVENIDIHQSFFDLGGQSLRAVMLLSRVRDAFQVEVPLIEFFECPTIAALAESVERLLVFEGGDAHVSQWIDEVEQLPVDDVRSLLENEGVRLLRREKRGQS